MVFASHRPPLWPDSFSLVAARKAISATLLPSPLPLPGQLCSLHPARGSRGSTRLSRRGWWLQTGSGGGLSPAQPPEPGSGCPQDHCGRPWGYGRLLNRRQQTEVSSTRQLPLESNSGAVKRICGTEVLRAGQSRSAETPAIPESWRAQWGTALLPAAAGWDPLAF